MRTVVLLLACSALTALTSPVDDAMFLDDLCSAMGNMAEYCTTPLTAAEYCAFDTAAISCTDDNRISSLTIFGFQGQIPTSISNLDELRSLFIFSSELPNGNGAFGLPDEISALPMLKVLSISGSNFEGLPASTDPFPALEVFNVENCQAIAPLSESIGEAPKLTSFRVVSSEFPGTFPTQFPVDTLTRFEVIETQITGQLPIFGADNSLISYKVSNNLEPLQFDDPDLLHGDSLEVFVITNNAVMTGQFPPSLGSSTTLREFTLDQQGFTGTVPQTLRYATGIRILSIGDIDTLQPIPESICELADLEILKLELSFVGSVPTCLRFLNRLGRFDVRGNGKDNCDPAENIVGNLPPGIIDGLIQTFDTISSGVVRVQIRDTCLGGPLPELVDGNKLASSSFLGTGTVRIISNRFTTPYPKWFFDLIDPQIGPVDSIALCELSDNLFCDRPPTINPGSACFDSVTVDGQNNVCGLCEQPNSACEDCAGVINGPARYDRCGVCAGTNDCVDCAGVVDGSSIYDPCDVCDGDGSLCYDCRGVMFGTSSYDLCDVCDGDGSSCLDCSGIAFGSFEYDQCDVCGGSGLTCADCEGVVDGPKELDVCNECVDVDAQDYRPSCVDCAGTPFGTAVRDKCHVCNGDGTTCDDARHVLAAQLALDRFGWLIVVPIVLVVLLCLVLAFVAFRTTGLGTAPRRPNATAPGRRRPQVRRPAPQASAGAAITSEIRDILFDTSAGSKVNKRRGR